MLENIAYNLKELFLTFFKKKPENIFVQFFRYLVVSGIALTGDYVLTVFLKEVLKIEFLIASRFGNLLGMIINYLLNIFWVFNKRKIENKIIEFLLFLLIGFLGMGVNFIIEFIFTKIIILYYLIAKTISVAIGYGVRFILRKYFLF